MGRLFFRSTASALDEKISGWRKISSTSTLRVTTTPTPSTGITGMASRNSLNMGWGWAAVSGSIEANGLSSPCRARCLVHVRSSGPEIGVLILAHKRSFGECPPGSVTDRRPGPGARVRCTDRRRPPRVVQGRRPTGATTTDGTCPAGRPWLGSAAEADMYRYASPPTVPGQEMLPGEHGTAGFAPAGPHRGSTPREGHDHHSRFTDAVRPGQRAPDARRRGTRRVVQRRRVRQHQPGHRGGHRPDHRRHRSPTWTGPSPPLGGPSTRPSWSTDRAFRQRCLRQLNEAIVAEQELFRSRAGGRGGHPGDGHPHGPVGRARSKRASCGPPSRSTISPGSGPSPTTTPSACSAG